MVMAICRRAASWILLAAGLPVLAGCATVPEPLRGEYDPATPDLASEEHIGQPVRWGGRLLDVRPEREQTCFEILSLPLDRTARPVRDAVPGQRFIACHDGFSDPAAWNRHRLITVTGILRDFETRPIGDFDYRFPVVETDALHAWAEPIPHPSYYHPYDPYWRNDPFWHPWSMPRHGLH